jgi:transposase
MPGTIPFSKGNIAWLQGLSLGFMDDSILRSDLSLLDTVEGQVELIEGKIAALAAEEHRVRLLMTMTGVGYFTAMLIVSEVGDISRFRDDKGFRVVDGLGAICPSVRGEDPDRGRLGSG